MLIIPDIFNKKEFLDAPLDYEWNNEASDFYSVDASNNKIEKILNGIDLKAVFGIATALCEWIYWRMSEHIDKPGIPLALEAQWAGVVDKYYFYSWSYEGDYVSDPINGPTYAMWMCMQYVSYNYEEENPAGMVSDVSRLALIARHICPNKKLFDEWLSDILRKETDLFPYKESSKEYGIPRQFFFEADFDYLTADNVKLINEFLSNLDDKKNQFLNSSKVMKKNGFIGTPYEYKE